MSSLTKANGSALSPVALFRTIPRICLALLSLSGTALWLDACVADESEPAPFVAAAEEDHRFAADPEGYSSPLTLFQWSYGTGFGGGAPLDEPLRADRPDFTEASTTVGRGVAQIEMGYTYRQDENGGLYTQSHRYPEMICRLGAFAEWFELRLGWNYAHEVEVAQVRDANHGADDMYLGAKIALTPQEGILPEMALTPQCLVPTGADELTANEMMPGVNWLYGWDVTDRISFGGSSQVNRAVDAETEDSFVLMAQSVVAGLQLTERIGSYWEWFVLVPDGADSASTEHYFNGGFTVPVTLDLQFDVRAGVGLNRAATDFFAGAGMVVRL